jgi:transcription elongation factor GreA
MPEQIYTQEGYNALINELEELKNVKLPQIKDSLAIARGYGDLSENSEYDEAKNEQAKTVYRIAELEQLIANAKIIDESKIQHDVVSVGSIVKVLDIEENEEVEYSIVGSNEANPLLGRISDQSPVGAALTGARVGDEITVESPGGSYKLRVLGVERAANK